MIFANRCTAGQRLAAGLVEYQGANPIVLALPRGGVPVGYEVAHALEAPLDVLVVRKLGAPGHAELAIGAVAPGVVVLDQETVALLRVPLDYIDEAIGREQREVERQLQIFRGDHPLPNLRARTVIVVDDGMATGSTALAAIDCVRRQGAARIVVGVPVAAPQAVAKLRAKADEVVCLETPGDFRAVGIYYEDFTQTTDAEVRLLLHRARLERETHFHPGARAT